MDAEPIADCDSSVEEPEDQEEDYTYASMAEGTTESECDDDAEELSTADVRWEKNELFKYSLQLTEETHRTLCTMYHSECHCVVCSDTCTCSNCFNGCLLFRVDPSMPRIQSTKVHCFLWYAYEPLHLVLLQV